MNIVGRTGKRSCYVVKTLLNAKGQIFAVPFADKGKGKRNTGYINAFVCRNRSTVYNPAGNIRIGACFYYHFNQAVINQNARARGNIVGQSGKGDAGNGFITFDFTGR